MAKVIFPLRDARIGKWLKVEKFLHSLPTLSRYYTLYPSSSYHIVVANVLENKDPAQWSKALETNHETWLKIHILLEERCRVSPYPRVAKLSYQDTLNCSLTFDGIDDSTVRVLRALLASLAAGLKGTKEEVCCLNFGHLNRSLPTPDSDDANALQADVQRFVEFLRSTLEPDNLIVPLLPAQLALFYNVCVYTPWNGVVPSRLKKDNAVQHGGVGTSAGTSAMADGSAPRTGETSAGRGVSDGSTS